MLMTTSERATLLKHLAASGAVKRKFPQFWRVKRLEPDALRKLAESVGIDAAEIRLSVQTAHARALSRLQRTARSGPKEAFSGTLGFVLNLEAFGLNTPRRARVIWEYTPEWPHVDRKGKLQVDQQEVCSMSAEIETVTTGEPIELPDGRLEPVTVTVWRPFDLLAIGVLGDDVVDRVCERIDKKAKAQNRARQKAARSVW